VKPGLMVALVVIFAPAAMGLTACGTDEVATAPSPVAASSVPAKAFPEPGFNPSSPGSLTYEGIAVSSRMVEVFIRDDASATEIAALGKKVAAMPEIETYTFISKEQALEEFREKLGDEADQVLANLETNPLPASFRMLAREHADAETVAGRFFDDPVIDNTPGTHDGVRFMSDKVYESLVPGS
jgi:hypothetical protein